MALTVKNPPAYRRPRFDPWIRKVPWRSEWQATAVFLPGESNEQRSLAGYSPWSCKELDMTEPLTLWEDKGNSALTYSQYQCYQQHLVTVFWGVIWHCTFKFNCAQKAVLQKLHHSTDVHRSIALAMDTTYFPINERIVKLW